MLISNIVPSSEKYFFRIIVYNAQNIPDEKARRFPNILSFESWKRVNKSLSNITRKSPKKDIIIPIVCHLDIFSRIKKKAKIGIRIILLFKRKEAEEAEVHLTEKNSNTGIPAQIPEDNKYIFHLFINESKIFLKTFLVVNRRIMNKTKDAKKYLKKDSCKGESWPVLSVNR